MKLLIIGNGGREHSLGIKLKENKEVTQIYFAKGNGGTADIGINIKQESITELCEFAKKEHIDLTIVGAEDLLVSGIVDTFQQNGLKIFGPHKKAAQLEGSKVFAKNFMQKYGVRTAYYKTFTNYKEALNYLDTITYPTVIKASGLAAGKGVVIAHDKATAVESLRKIMQDKVFGESGNQIVIEEYLEGLEASILSYFNGKEIVPFISAKDHKKIGENETGLNTGGMGAIAPNPYVTEEVMDDFTKNILSPTLKGLNAEKLQFSGVIFFGLMLTKKGAYLLEYNLRMGDPETQTVLPLLDTDLLSLTQDAIAGEKLNIKWKDKHSCCVVMVSGGYPENYQKGYVINGLEKLDSLYFVAGAEKVQDQLQTTGGRVLNIVAIGDTAKEAREKAYKEVEKISFEKAYYRKDIGKI